LALDCIIDIYYNDAKQGTDMQYLSGWSYHQLHLRNTWQSYTTIWRLKTQEAELEGLTRWAERKRLKRQLQTYSARLQEVEERLLLLRFRYPHRMLFISILHIFFTNLRGERRYKSGSAKKYRYRMGQSPGGKAWWRIR
jgi:hypothetical protein